ncbi:MAG: hypothetical protein QF412_09060 [Planctomycetota bacterium]|nr:hypothetical protein [Planctomycetota bacterium]
MTDPVQIRSYQPGDEVGILDCYNRIFPTDDGRIGGRTLEHWNWKFLDNPVGCVQGVVADHEEEGIIGSYAGVPVRIWSEGREQLAAQGVDLMVLPKWRRHGRRPGLFIHLGWKYHELYCGATEGKVLFTYGWPIPAWRMGQRYLGYWNIRDWDFLFTEIEHREPRSAPAGMAVQQVASYGEDVTALWTSLRPSFGLALIRDATYLNWRYGRRPDRSYRLFECREDSTGALRGVCVYAVDEVLQTRAGFIVDWLVPADDQDATVALLAAVERQARDDGVGVVATVLNHVDPRFLGFQRLGFMVMGTPYFLVLASFKYDTAYYRDEWFFTMGDSDLI